MAHPDKHTEKHKELILPIVDIETGRITKDHTTRTTTIFIMRGYQPNERQGTRANMRRAAVQDRPYTSAEDDWLVKNWGGESKFLRYHGLTMDTEESRSAGRHVARALIAVDSEDEYEDRHDHHCCSHHHSTLR